MDNNYLTCEICSHDLVDESLVCQYCGETLTPEQAIKVLSANLQMAKQQLTQAIEQKEDIASINNKTLALYNAISNTEAICKAYSDTKDQQLKQELENLISIAKQEAISSSNTTLERAKNELMNVINEKLDTETFKSKIKNLTKELTDAITIAENSSKQYADSVNSALKSDLQSKIEESKTTLQNINNEIIERLSNAEKEIDTNTKSIKALKTTIIVLSVIFATLTSSAFIVLIILIIKKKA